MICRPATQIQSQKNNFHEVNRFSGNGGSRIYKSNPPKTLTDNHPSSDFPFNQTAASSHYKQSVNVCSNFTAQDCYKQVCQPNSIDPNTAYDNTTPTKSYNEAQSYVNPDSSKFFSEQSNIYQQQINSNQAPSINQIHPNTNSQNHGNFGTSTNQLNKSENTKNNPQNHNMIDEDSCFDLLLNKQISCFSNYEMEMVNQSSTNETSEYAL